MVELKGVPKSLWNDLRAFFAGSIIDIVWKLFLTALFIALVIFLASFGILGVIMAFIIFGAFFSDAVRDNISDLWNRRWAES